MKKYKDFSLAQYLTVLSAREPVPGGGSAAALVGASGISLLLMVARYSQGKSTSKSVEKQIAKLIAQADIWQKDLTAIIDRDAEAYLRYSKTPKTDVKVKRLAAKEAARIPKEICQICYKAVCSTPVLAKYGNKYLMSDLEIALEFLWAAYRSAFILTQQN